jgi:hypothetical protein
MTPTEPVRGTPDVIDLAADLKTAKKLSARDLKTMMFGMLYGGLKYFDETVRYRPDPPVKPCLACGKPKRHNNAFCSAECCRVWKKK